MFKISLKTGLDPELRNILNIFEIALFPLKFKFWVLTNPKDMHGLFFESLSYRVNTDLQAGICFGRESVGEDIFCSDK